MTTMDDETLRAMLADYATATAKRPPCEAGLDPDACDACIAWTSESLDAGVRLWGKARAPGTITALAAEVLRLRERAARADSDASGYLADHAAALLDLGAATSRAEKAEAAHATIQRVAREYFAALDTGNAHLAGAVIERDDPHYTALVIAEQAAEARLRALVGEGGR